MSDRHDPEIMALVVELAESAHLAPSYDELEDMFERGGEDVVVDYALEAEHRHAPGAATPRRRNRRVGLAVAAAAAILVVAAGVVVVDRGDDGVATDSVSQPSVAEPAAPSGVAEPVPSVWPVVFQDEAGLEGDVTSAIGGVVAGGPGFVAVGGRDDKAAVWTSVDGLTWTRLPHDEEVFGGEGRQGMSDVTVGGPGLVAVGGQDVCTDSEVALREDPSTTCEDGTAVVWTSVDGLTWTRVPHDEAVFGGLDNQAMSDVTVGGPGLVAVGRDGGGPGWDNPVGDQGAAVWTSVDGLTWKRVSHDEAAFGAGKPAMVSVTAGGPGLVAVGYSFPSSAPASVWTSVDGLTWTRVAHDNGDEMRGTMVDVTVGGPGLLAAGSGSNGAAVWSSPDGLTWSLDANGDIEPGHDASFMSALTSADGRMVAVGSVSPDRDSQLAAAWTSPNP